MMENLVESYLTNAGLRENITYFKQMKRAEINKKFNINLSSISKDNLAEKRFDFVFIGANDCIYACECNFYGNAGSKLNETARSYKELALELQKIEKFRFVWITDGIGWNFAKNNLRETFDILDDLYNINDLENGAIKKLVDVESYIALKLE